jgi:hypothetical protein
MTVSVYDEDYSNLMIVSVSDEGYSNLLIVNVSNLHRILSVKKLE